MTYLDKPAGGRLTGRRPLALVVLLLISAAVQGYYEPRPVIRMSDVLTSQQAQSLYHRVEDIELSGKFYDFRVHSDMGTYNISSMAMFRKRVEEISTLSQAMNQVRDDDRGLSSELQGQFSIRADSAIDIISRPVESAADLAGQFADNLEETLTGQSRRTTSGTASYLVQESSDPVAAMHKRNIASQWGLDVYSSNLNVQQFLNSITRARSGGKISAGTPTLRSQIRRPPKAADVQVESTTAYLLKSKGVRELQQVNRQLLESMNVNEPTIDRFLNQSVFSPRHQTRICHYLDAIKGLKNRGAFVEAALAAEDEVMALAFDESAMMLKHYHEEIGGLNKLNAGDEVLEAVGNDRRIAYFVPVDMIYWSEETEALFDSLQKRAMQSGFSSWELVTAGRLTPEARKQLQQRKFVVRETFVDR